MKFPTEDRLGLANRMIGAKAVCNMTSLSRFAVYQAVKTGSFPAPYQIGPKRIAWRESEIMEWLDSRPQVSWAEASAREAVAA